MKEPITTDVTAEVSFTERVQEGLAHGMERYGAAHELPPIRWSLDGGPDSLELVGIASTGDYPDEARVNAAARWAGKLVLSPVDLGPDDYRVEYAGLVGRLPVRVWAVTDHDAWEAAVGLHRITTGSGGTR